MEPTRVELIGGPTGETLSWFSAEIQANISSFNLGQIKTTAQSYKSLLAVINFLPYETTLFVTFIQGHYLPTRLEPT
jgi:hypothetical protein